MNKLVITGASTGIGHAIALRAAREGWRVLATVRNEAHLAALEDHGCETATLELRDAASIEAFTAHATAWSSGHLDALVNNAGVAFPGAVEELSMDDVREQFAVNLFGHLHVTQRLLRSLRAARGRIIFISSNRAERCVPMYGAYVASKRALNAFAETLAEELKPAGVSVDTLELGSFESNIRTAIRTRLENFERDGSAYVDLLRNARENLGSPPIGDPDEAAREVLALLTRPIDV